jgi:hypothetical protein
MTFKTAFVAAAAFVALAGVASAKEAATITLAAPVEGVEKVIADSAVWACEGATCTTTLRSQPTVRGCKDVAKELGPVVTYGHAGRQLSEADLAKCNASAKAMTATATASTQQ